LILNKKIVSTALVKYENFFKFCQIAGGNQEANTAVRPLEPQGAPRNTLNPQAKN